jgi:hypothetical protein
MCQTSVFDANRRQTHAMRRAHPDVLQVYDMCSRPDMQNGAPALWQGAVPWTPCLYSPHTVSPTWCRGFAPVVRRRSGFDRRSWLCPGKFRSDTEVAESWFAPVELWRQDGLASDAWSKSIYVWIFPDQMATLADTQFGFVVPGTPKPNGQFWRISKPV